MVALEGMSWGMEIGGESIDILIFVMNPDGANSILTAKAKIGDNATASAGTVGRDVAAESDDVVLHSADTPPAPAKLLLDTLNQQSPKNLSDPKNR